MKRHKGEKNVKSSFNETSSPKNEVNHVPLCIIEEILVKLPIKCVLRCKAVRKSWYNLITSPNFSKLYVKSSPFTWVLGLRKLDIQSLYLLEIEGDNVDVIGSPLYPKIVSSRETEVLEVYDSCSGICCRPGRFRLKGPAALEVVASCNGLCCFIEHYSTIHRFYETRRSPAVIICNPISGECVELPKGKFHVDEVTVYEICFNPSTRRYKVVRIGRFNGVVCHVFTLGVDKNWRNIEDSSLPSGLIRSSVSFNGLVHCLGTHRDHIFIYALNVEEEKGRCFSCPPGFRGDIFNQLTVMDDHLCVVRNTTDQIDIWVMKEYGVAESWTRNIILKDWISHSVPLTLLKDGRLLFCIYSPNDLIEVHQKDKYNVVSGPGNFDTRLAFVPCFSSLKDIMAGGHDDTSVNPSQNSS